MKTLDIKHIRKSVYYTQQRFAEALGVHVNTVRRWEKGDFFPNITQQGKIVEFCKVNKIKITEE